jgi:hypothetical protein
MAKQIRLLRSVLALPGSRLKMTETVPLYGADVIVPNHRTRA